MADIFLTNTLTRKKEKFVPIKPPSGEAGKKVQFYTCGPTVYRDIHIGNLRTYLSADILRRVLIFNGYEVNFVKNITDVGHMRTDPSTSLRASEDVTHDPIITEALKKGESPKNLAKEYTKQFLEDEKKLNILPADHQPKATEYIEQMIKLIKILINKGFAYPSTSSGQADGNVYFDVKKFVDYGKLSGNTLDKMDQLLEAVRVSSETDKKDAIDFALWKKADPEHILQWDSPWGKGFPGWHIECSVMSLDILTDAFKEGTFSGERSRTIDVHAGGEDLIFPHHENEIAQSESATGEKFVNYWIHSGWLLIDSKKMSRREGNVYTMQTIIEKGFNPLAFRYLTLTAHYRSRLNFTWESLQAAQNALDNIYKEVSKFAIESDPKVGCAEYEEKFLKALNDDLDTPSALAVVQELVKSDYPASAKLKSLFKFDEILGLDLEKVAKRTSTVPNEVKKLLGEREKARAEKDFEKSDALRKQITSRGFEVVDTPEGARLKKIIS
jgi:cysteinyl-tRNA synthetase